MTTSPETTPPSKPGDYARTILKQQLDEAEQDLASSIDTRQMYDEQIRDEELRVRELKAALEDLDGAATRAQQLERTVVGRPTGPADR